MKTFYKSDVTGRTYDNEDEANKDEAEFKKTHEKELALRNEKASRAKDVQEAYAKYAKVCNDNRTAESKAYDEYLGLRNKFVEDYGYFHMTYSDVVELPDAMDDVMKDAVNWLMEPIFRL